MKKLLYLSLFVLISVFTVISSCKKDQVPDSTACTTCQKVTEAKDYFAFKVGTWWVYEEETTLERDSMYVTSSSVTAGYNFDTYIYSELQGYYYHYYPFYAAGSQSCSQTVPINSRCLYIHREKYKSGDYIGNSTVFFVKYAKGNYETTGSDMDYCPNNKIIIEDIFVSYELLGETFDKTIKIHELCSFVEGKQPTNHFYSKGIGIIRKELIDSNQVWNLVNYHIEP